MRQLEMQAFLRLWNSPHRREATNSVSLNSIILWLKLRISAELVFHEPDFRRRDVHAIIVAAAFGEFQRPNPPQIPQNPAPQKSNRYFGAFFLNSARRGDRIPS
jgi:hypothetical protein